MTILYKRADMPNIEKHRVKLSIPDLGNDLLNVLHVECEQGHFQEFSLTDITFVYTVLEGRGVFFIDDQPHVAEAGDIVAIPPQHRIWYAGRLRMVLTCTPAFEDHKEIHHRFISQHDMDEAWQTYRL